MLCANVLESADGPVHLDDVRPSRDLPPDDLHHFFRRIRDSAAFRWRSAWTEWRHGAEPVPADEHPGAHHGARVDQVAHSYVGVFSRAQIAHRGDFRFQRLFLRQKDRFSHHALQLLVTREGPGRAVPVIGHVGVHVDQPRQADIAGPVDDLRSRGR